MAKIVIFLSLALLLQAEVNSSCLACHAKNQIPNQLIYKRYLMKYSTEKNIEKAMIEYLKNPDQKNSIMPSAFFTKFPMKKAMTEKNLKDKIREFIKLYDIKKRLVL